ncbi:hypothetical protein DMC63_32925, partial [Streptomyces sp. WAC 05977]
MMLTALTPYLDRVRVHSSGDGDGFGWFLLALAIIVIIIVIVVIIVKVNQAKKPPMTFPQNPNFGGGGPAPGFP